MVHNIEHQVICSVLGLVLEYKCLKSIYELLLVCLDRMYDSETPCVQLLEVVIGVEMN
jgi:hypothetical protein